LNIVDTALSLVTDLTSQIIQLETRLASHRSLMIDDNHILHHQFDDLNDIDQHLQPIEKSMQELLQQSQQLASEQLKRITEQLSTRWKRIHAEINQR
jgi:capsule polysaccharide export protein KpsE/RkpR